MFHRRRGPAHWADARLVRYADDFVVTARSVEGRLTGWMEETLEGWLALTLNRETTQVIDLRQSGSSLDFPGYTFRFDRDRYGHDQRYLNMVPSKRALARARWVLREMTDKRMCFKPVPALITEINVYLRSWSVYFNHGYPRAAFRGINAFTRQRLYRHLRRRSQRPWRPPNGTTVYAQLARMGLLSL